MVKTLFDMKINFKRKLYSTKTGGTASGGFFWDKDNFDSINLEYSCFDEIANLIDSLPIGAKITGEGKIKNKNSYSKTATQEDNNAREITITKITKYAIWDDNKKRLVISDCDVTASKRVNSNYGVENDFTQPQPKPKEIAKQEFNVTDDDLPF
ncbi:MAG: hypothetical protein M0R51_16380 [Clostridia bacterium]|jgi:hypothetical protein|nr:hypothetical protein [Clostridia bacterium]